MGSNRTRNRQVVAARTKEAVAKTPLEQHQDVTAANTERILRALDDFANPAARLGVGSTNLLEATQYPLTRITRLYMLMQSLYRSNWVAQRIADTYPELMCKVPPVLTCQEKPENLDKFYRAVEQYQVWAKLEWAMKLANVFGGAGAVIIIDGHENYLDEPLDLEDVKPRSFRGVIPFDRWSGINPSGIICNDINRPLDYGLPESYIVTTATGGTISVHASRVLRFTGKDLQLWEQQSEMWWGESLFEGAWEEIKKRDNMSFNIVSLMFRAQILGLKIPSLDQIISGVGMPGPAAQQFQRTLQAQSDLMSNQGLAVFGKDGGFDSHQYTFGGMAEIYHELMKDVAASAEIPYELVFGREGGLGANGETSLQILYDRVGHKQKTKLHPQLQKLYPVVAMSCWGEVPDDFGWKFPTPRTMSNKERAELADALTKPVIEAFNAGLISQKTALMEFQQNADTTEVFSNITDEDVAKADAEVAKPMEMGGGEEPGFGSGSEEGQGEQGKAGSPHSKEPRPAGGEDAVDFPSYGGSARVHGKDDDNFIESEHPRDTSGKFAKGSGGGGLKSYENKDSWPAHIKALKLPPAWTDVKVAEDPNSDLLAVGKDAKGRAQYVYSRKFADSQAAAKFSRVQALQTDKPMIERQLANACKSKDVKEREHAECATLILKLGIRPGSDTDTKADKQAYGATTLRGEHVATENGQTFLRFTGKKGVALNLPVGDATLANALKARAKTAGANGKLFSDVTDASLRDFVHSKLDHGAYKPKDFRTLLANDIAVAAIASATAPTDERSYKRAVLDVAKQVSAKLGNTPTVALQSYINPLVFGAWRGVL